MAGFEKQSTGQIRLDSIAITCLDLQKQMIKINPAEQEISPFLFHANLGTYITYNATWPLSDIEVGNFPVYMQLPLEPQRALYYLFHICCTPQYLYTL